ncbi:hypothetical protein NIES2101_28875 [Calothrix sp. HK-06]|nr:hypothetical protein NIES2101_28875 [Calothrix sp. HK-06]
MDSAPGTDNGTDDYLYEQELANLKETVEGIIAPKKIFCTRSKLDELLKVLSGKLFKPKPWKDVFYYF